MNKELINLIEKLMREKLQAKTGWGRNEVIGLLTDSIKEATLEFID